MVHNYITIITKSFSFKNFNAAFYLIIIVPVAFWVYLFILHFLEFKINSKNIISKQFYQSIKSFVMLACNEFTGPISASLRPGNTALFEKMLQGWRAVGNTVSIWPALDSNLRPPAPETNALPLDQVELLNLETAVNRLNSTTPYLCYYRPVNGINEFQRVYFENCWCKRRIVYFFRNFISI